MTVSRESKGFSILLDAPYSNDDNIVSPLTVAPSEYRAGPLNACCRSLQTFPLKAQWRTVILIVSICVFPFMIALIVVGNRVAKSFDVVVEWRLSPASIPADPKSAWLRFFASSHTAAVATDVRNCSEFAADLLRRGGNAVDAAIGAALCVGVMNPASSGIGGGCFVLVYNATTGESTFIDARETAPAAATASMFARAPMTAQDGGLAIAVPAELDGLYTAWQRYGSSSSSTSSEAAELASNDEMGMRSVEQTPRKKDLPLFDSDRTGKVETRQDDKQKRMNILRPEDPVTWQSILESVADMAERVVVSPELALLIREVEPQLYSGLYPGLSTMLLRPDGGMKNAGDIIERPKFAHTLRMIGKYGPSYIRDTIASDLANEIQSTGGIITEDDIRGYKIRILNPIKADFMGHTYVGASGCSSGGVTVAAILKLMGGYVEPAVSAGGVYHHRLVETFKHVFAMRMFLGDPNFVNTTSTVAAMLDDEYLASLRASTSDFRPLPSLDNYGGRLNRTAAQGPLPTDHGTSHMSVIDKFGNAVALTSTINTYFGSKVVSPSSGILFNNEMDDFSIPEAENYFHLAPFPNNYPEPGKRPVSSMSPSFVIRRHCASRVVLSASSKHASGRGGDTYIFNSLIQATTSTLRRLMLGDNRQLSTAIQTKHRHLRSSYVRPVSSLNFDHAQDPVRVGPTGSYDIEGERVLGERVENIAECLALIGGASGGPHIITGTAQVILNVVARGLRLLDAVREPRLHSQLYPDVVYYENFTLVSGLHVGVDKDTVLALSQRGQGPLDASKAVGNTQFIAVDPDSALISAVSDPRKDGWPAVVIP